MSDRNPEYDLTAPHLPMNHPQNVERRLRDEIERLRAERDALRDRIEGAAVVKVRGAAIYVSHSLIGKRVALVPVDE